MSQTEALVLGSRFKQVEREVERELLVVFSEGVMVVCYAVQYRRHF